MKFRTENTAPRLPCPQCHKLASSDSKTCPACGAEMYVECPQCGTRRGAEDEFCRKCGFNFSRKKLHLKDVAPSGAPSPGDALPRLGLQKPGKTSRYRMTPRMAGIRAFFMLIFLLAIAAALFFAANRDWGQAVGKIIREQVGRVSSGGPASAGKPQKDAQPDWKARYQYWFGYYRDVFSLPPKNTMVKVGLGGGMTAQGLFVQVADGSLVLLKDGQKFDYPRLALDDDTRRVFFYDDFASAKARVRVKAEKAEWQYKALQPKAAPGSNLFSGLLHSHSAGSVASTSSPVITFLDIKCPVCAGMGYLLVTGGAGQSGSGLSGIGLKGGSLGLQPASQPKPQTVKQPCPVCGGKGFRRFDRVPYFPWPAGASRCGNCHGMGAVLLRSGQGRKQATRCQICDGRGYVINQYDAARNVPPKY